MTTIILAHAAQEKARAEPVARALRSAGYNVLYEESVLVGDSLIEETSNALGSGSPVVLCGTVTAAGMEWTHKLVNAARSLSTRVFALKMDSSAYLGSLSLGESVAAYCDNPGKAIDSLLEALQRHYPLESTLPISPIDQSEHNYCDLVLRLHDIIDLANLPVADRNLVTRELLLRNLYVALRVGMEAASESSNLHETQDIDKAERRSAFSKQKNLGATKRWSVGERLAKARKLVVLGDPGAGKSTLLRWIATAYCLRFNAHPDWQQLPDVADLPDEDWLPILIRCRDLEKPQAAQSLEQILGHHLRKLGITGIEGERLNERLLRRLSEGRAILLIDGLDEIVRSTTRAAFCRQIEHVRAVYPHAPIIVTSRIVGYRETGLRIARGFEHVNILDLTADDKDEFVRRWCSLTEPISRIDTAIDELIRDIHSTDRIERLTDNPMLLTTIALVKKKVGKFLSKRVDLYREAVGVLLNWRSDIDRPLDPDEALPQLEYVAFAMCQDGVQRLRADEITDLLAKMRGEYRNIRAARYHEPLDFLKLLERRTGILIEIGRIIHRGALVPVYEFKHLTFQYYLASLALVQGHFPQRNKELTLAQTVEPLAAQIPKALTSQVNKDNNDYLTIDENWREVLRLCVMSCKDDDVDDVLLTIAGIRNNQPISPEARPRIMLAVGCLADEPNVSQVVALTLIDNFIGILRETDRPVALVAGRPIGGTFAGSVITEIGMSSWGPDFARHLITAWLNAPDHDSMIGACAARAAGQLAPDDDQGLQTWLSKQAALLSNESSIERISAALSIMHVTFESRNNFRKLQPKMVPTLGSKLINMLDRPGREAEAAAWAISWLARIDKSNKAIWKLSGKQESDLVSRIVHPRTTILTAQFLALALTRQHSKNFKLADSIARTFGNSSRYHLDPLIKCYARLFPDYVQPIVPMADHTSPMVRAAFARLLGQMVDERRVELLIALLSDPDAQVVAAAVEGLGGVRDARAVEPLIRILTGPHSQGLDSQVRNSVARALGQLGDARAVEPLIGVLTCPDGQAIEEVVYALGDLGDDRAVEPLIGALVDLEGKAREDVAYALGQLGDIRAVEPLIGMLTGPDGQAVEEADEVAYALGQLRDARAVEPLIEALTGPDGKVREDVAYALVQLGDVRAVEPLIEALTGPDGKVREDVAYALGQLGDVRAVEPLIEALTGPDGKVREGVTRALGQLGDVRAVEPLIEALTGPNGKLREEVEELAYALGQLGDIMAVEPLIAINVGYMLDAPSGLMAALATLGNDSAFQEFQDLMRSASSSKRMDALWALARCEQNKYDRILLSRDADGESPGLDPKQQITMADTQRYARAAKLSDQEVRVRYERLQKKYLLNLSWT
jgi:HEAT repeat protein